MKKLKIVIFSIFLFSTIYSVSAHPLHLTITNIDITNDSVKIVIRLFTDDFTNAILTENLINKPINITDKKNKELIKSYILSNFRIQINSNTVILNHSKNEFDDESILVFLEAKITTTTTKININNKLLCNLFGDQRNMVIVKYNTNEKGVMFSSTETEKIIFLDGE